MCEKRRLATACWLKMLTWEEDLVFSAIVLETARGAPRRRLGSVEDKRHVFVQSGLDTRAHALVHANQALHFLLFLYFILLLIQV